VDTDRISEYSSLLSILANPTRLMILKELLLGTKCVNDMQEILEVSQPNVSQHLIVLKESGLVFSHKRGTSRCYHLAKPVLVRNLFAWLSREYKTLDPVELRKCGTGKAGRVSSGKKRKAPSRSRKA